MKVLKKLFIIIGIFLCIVTLLFVFGIMWKSPSRYKIEKYRKVASPVMDMVTYEKIMSTHRRPYIYSITAKNGATVSIVGVEHINNQNHPQLDSIRAVWNKLKPDIALVEGRLGFLFTWFENPIEKYGERGLTSSLAKKQFTKLYSWEPSREDEIALLLKKYSKEQLALFYSLRPYLGRQFSNPEAKIQEFINSRTDYKGIRNVFQSSEDLDSEWKEYYPKLDWRTYSNKRGLMPQGVMSEIWNSSNQARDEHMIQIILEVLEKKKNVFVTMGVSHAPRIEHALRSSIR